MQNQAVIKTTKLGGNRGLVLFAAFAAIYVFWGSTYLAIKYAVETLPPFLMAGTRFVFAGAVLFLWACFSKDYEPPKAAHWKTSFIVGTLLLLGGNGGVVFAERHISSAPVQANEQAEGIQEVDHILGQANPIDRDIGA